MNTIPNPSPAWVIGAAKNRLRFHPGSMNRYGERRDADRVIENKENQLARQGKESKNEQRKKNKKGKESIDINRYIGFFFFFVSFFFFFTPLLFLPLRLSAHHEIA